MLPDGLTSRAVLIGTSNYDHLSDLPAVERNLIALSELLQDPTLCGLPPEHCELVQNPMVAEEMIDPIAEAAAEAKDLLFVYFAGHGALHPTASGLYLACVGSDNKHMYRSAAYDHIRDELKESSAKSVVVILDCCYSGQALNTMSGRNDSTQQLADGAALRGTCLIASTAENKRANAGSKFTTFTGQLIDLIDKGMPEEGELLTLDALFEATRTALEEQGFPTPQRREKDYGAKLTLFRNRSKRAVSKNRAFYGRVPQKGSVHWFPDRRSLHEVGIHRPLQSGICGTAARGGAESIVVSGGYEDKDYGDVIIYTGHGGRDPETRKQVKDQTAKHSGNAALIKSMLTGLPVRVIRGAGGKTEFSPDEGYHYDGLFTVKDYWVKASADGPKVLQFRLEKLTESTSENGPHRRSRHLSVGRWAEAAPGEYYDQLLGERLKQIYSHACQICDLALQTPGGLGFSCVVYIRAIELPHRGPDAMDNMLCLCPNHRDLFKFGALTIDDNLIVIDQRDGEEMGVLTVKHDINLEYIKYHRECHATNCWDAP